MDALDLVEAADVASKIQGSFYSQMESKKWGERKEALEVVEKATSVPKIQNSDFSELVRVLKKTIAKDANIVVATLAAKCLCQLAQGLRYDFAPYADSTLSVLFEKFKEKKPNVISVIRDAADAAFVGTNIENVFEEVIQFLDNKNPQIKSELALFIARTFSRYPQQVRNKKTLRPLINALVKTLSDMDSTVRDNSAMAIGTAMKVMGENLLMPLLGDVEPIKISKIKEFCEKAEIVAPQTNGQVTNDGPPTTHGLNGQMPEQLNQVNGVQEDDDEDEEERIYDMMEAADVASKIQPSFFSQMESKKWIERKEALEVVEKATSVPKIQNSDFSELVRVLKKTVAKDANIVVATLAAKCLCQLAQGLRYDFAPYADSSLSVIFEKFKEKKPNVISVLRDAADAAFVGTNIENIFEEVIQFLDNKNPQIKSELALFLSRAFSRFPLQVRNKKTLRPLINALVKTLSDMDSTVRDNSAMAIGTIMKVMGENLLMPLLGDVEPIKISKIKEFREKAQIKKIPKSALAAMNSASNNVQQASAPSGLQGNSNQTTTSHQPRHSSATMVRSTSNRRLTTTGRMSVAGGGLASRNQVNHSAATNNSTNPNATVKRNATIIKRSTVPKKSTAPTTQTNSMSSNSTATSSMGPPTVNSMSTSNSSVNSNTTQGLAAPNQQPIASTPAKPVYTSTNLTNVVTNKFLNKQEFEFDTTIFKLISNSPNEVLNSLTELQEGMNESNEHEYKRRINQIIDLACLQLIKTIDSLKASPSEENLQIQKLERISDLIKKLFSNRQLVLAASHQSIRFLLVQLFILAQGCASSTPQQQDDGFVQKSLNNLAIVVMDGFEPTSIMCILTGLLNEPSPASIVEPVKDAIIRSMRSFK